MSHKNLDPLSYIYLPYIVTKTENRGIDFSSVFRSRHLAISYSSRKDQLKSEQKVSSKIVVALTRSNYYADFSFQPGTSQLVLVRQNLHHKLYTMSRHKILASNCLDKNTSIGSVCPRNNYRE